MKSRHRKFMQYLLCIAMAAAMMPGMAASVYAQDDNVGVAQVSCGTSHTGILKNDGSLWMTGRNNYGQLGDGTNEAKSKPAKIESDVAQISCGLGYTGIIKKNGSLWVTGDNSSGQLGDGTHKSKTEPVKIMDDVAQVSRGFWHTGIVKKDGSLWMTGTNYWGEFGNGTADEGSSSPVKIMDGVAQVSCGICFTGILKKDGSLWMTGTNDDGQLGDGSNADRRATPVKIMDGVAQISCSYASTGVVKKDGSLWMFGSNSSGNLGDGTTRDKNKPVKIMDDVAQVSCGYYHTGIVKEDGSLWMTGSNYDGQLGNGTTVDSTYPVKIMDDVVQVSCWYNHTGILKNDGSLWMTGNNEDGQLGDGTQEKKVKPVKIMSGGSTVTPVALDKSSSNLAPGKTLTLKASGPSDIAYKTSSKSVATVTSAGVVKGVKPGTATITAYSKSKTSNKATCKITVKYKLTYNMNGGANSSKNPTWYTGTVTLANPTARTGWDFKGWYSDAKFKTKVKSVKNANKTLYAKWAWHNYYIKFEKNGGTGNQYYQDCRYDKTFKLPACKYTRKGYRFIGWNTKADGSGKSYNDQASFRNLTSVDNKTIKFYAQWATIRYTITYKGLPEGAKNDNRDNYRITSGKINLKNASCPGYDFKGWYSNGGLTNKITSIAKNSTGDKKIYSKWTPHKYTIKFNANGGSGTMKSMPSLKYGKQYNLTANAFQLEYYVFKNWNTKADGTGIDYEDGAAVKNLVTKNGGSVTLYAQWKPDTVLYWPVRNEDLSPIVTIKSHPGDIVAGSAHRGIDIDGPVGAKWFSASSGTIIYVFRGCTTSGDRDHSECSPNHPELKSSSNAYGVVCNNGFGNGCVIKSIINGQTYYFQYAHMDRVSDNLVEGAEINRGTYLGEVGNKGFSFGPHAHFEIDLETSPGSYWGHPVNNDPGNPECIFTYMY